MPATADSKTTGSGSAHQYEPELSANRVTVRLTDALQARDFGTVDRMARTMACLRPDDPEIVEVSHRLPAGENLNTRAAVGRMAQCLDPSEPLLHRERIHRSIKANRPDLMPPHWMREVMFEADRLQTILQAAGLDAALTYLENPELAGHRHYMPRFRALRHFVLFNAVPAYRDAFLKHSIRVVKYADGGSPPRGEAFHEELLQALVKSAAWRTRTDTIVVSEEMSAAQNNVRKRIRAGTIGNDGLPESVTNLKKFIYSVFGDYWFKHQKFNLTRELFGFNKKGRENVTSLMTLNINEILEGPVLGPHYHSGFRYDEELFALISGVYYPRSVPRNDDTRAGYLEIGRPDFVLPFEPICLTHRPVAGDLVLFPAFAYHGVVPIDQAPRYSVNIDVFLKPKNAASWSISEFFDEPP